MRLPCSISTVDFIEKQGKKKMKYSSAWRTFIYPVGKTARTSQSLPQDKLDLINVGKNDIRNYSLKAIVKHRR